ncbi:MAG: tetratricopeptide repeat protein [Caldilineaceae bacterium]
MSTQARYDDAIAAAQDAIALAAVRTLRLSSLGYLHWGGALWYAGEVTQAQPLVTQALALAQADGLRRAEVDSLRLLGSIALRSGEHAEALRLHRQSLYIARKIEDRHRESQALHRLGAVTCNQGDFAQARTYVEESLHIYRA